MAAHVVEHRRRRPAIKLEGICLLIGAERGARLHPGLAVDLVVIEAARREALANNEEAQLEMKRQDRKDRKAQAKAEARAKREAKSAQRRG